MTAVAWRKHVTGSSGDVAMEQKMAGVVAGVQGMDLEKGGKRRSDCSTKNHQSSGHHASCHHRLQVVGGQTGLTCGEGKRT